MIHKATFKQLFDNDFDTIRSFIFYRCGDADAASDMAQDIFMKIWEKRAHLKNNHLKALLYKMANDAIISAYRKDVTRMGFERSMTTKNEATRSPEEELTFKELSASYARALEKMPEIHRIVFLMNRNDDRTYNEIADTLRISVKAVEKRMSAALQFLRTELL